MLVLAPSDASASPRLAAEVPLPLENKHTLGLHPQHHTPAPPSGSAIASSIVVLQQECVLQGPPSVRLMHLGLTTALLWQNDTNIGRMHWWWQWRKVLAVVLDSSGCGGSM